MGGRGGSSHGGGGGANFSGAEQFLNAAYGVRHARAILDIIRNAPAAIQAL